jgi:hypothetical protein
MDSINITYHIELSEEVTEVFKFTLDGETFALEKSPVVDPPNWTQLEYKQCSHCPLSAQEHTHCPVALQLHSVISRFHGTTSIDKVGLRVITPERDISRRVSLQRAVSSMLGLLFPTCGCPKTLYLRPLARFHLPLASDEETVLRVAGMYLLSQYFMASKGKPSEMGFKGLTVIYDNLHILNKAIASRLQHATNSDSAKNAIALLDMYSNLVPVLIDDQLEDISSFFDVYLPAALEPAPRAWAIRPHNKHTELAGQLYNIEGTMVVGRAADCDLQFSVSHLSRRHAELTLSNGALKVKDLGSSNGTFVNGKRIKEVLLEDGDELRLDALYFTVHSKHG